MSITITVAGVNRDEFVSQVQPAGWTDTLNGRGTGTIVFNVRFAKLATFRPIDGQTILIEEDLGGGDVARFGGFLVEPQATELPDEKIVSFSCGMQDNNAIADRRIITASFDEVAVEDIVDAIVSNANGDGLTGEGITQTGVVPGAAISIEFPTIYVTEALNDLGVKADGRWWNIAHDKDLTVAPRTAVPAPGDLTGANTLKKTVRVRPVKEKYRNVEIVFGGKDDFTISGRFEDAVEIAARAAIEGGTSGRYEHIEERQDILDSVLVEELAEDLVTRFGTVTLLFECVTRDPGYASGQEVDAIFPNLELNPTTFLIDSVSAQIVYSDEDGTEPEIWYSIQAITGDPFGGWMEHFRKRPGSSQERDITPPPGVTINCDPGVVVHDPPPGPFEWFQGPADDPTRFPLAFGLAQSGTHLVAMRQGGLAGSGGCGGGVFPGCGPPTEPVQECFASRQTILELWAINPVTRALTLSACGSLDQPNAGANYKKHMPMNANALIGMVQASVSDTTFLVGQVVFNSTIGFLGQTPSTMPNNGNLSEAVWVGSHCYFIDGASGDLFTYDCTTPGSPIERAVVATSCTAIRSLVASPDGNSLYAAGGTIVSALDISDRNAPVEDNTLAVANYLSLDMNDDGDKLIMFRRNSSTVVGYTVIAMTLNGTDIAFEEESGTVSLSTSVMEGVGCVWRGNKAVVYNEFNVNSGVNALRAHIFDTTDTSALVVVETLLYNHGTVNNRGPIRQQNVPNSYYYFGGVTHQITYGVQTFPKCVDLSTQFPLEADFGGTGHKEYDPGDILFADTEETLARRVIGNEGDVLTVASGLPVWEPAVVPSGQVGAGVVVACMLADVQFDSTSLVDISGLSHEVLSGETYYFRADLFFDITAADSHRYAIGGTCQGDIRYQVRALDDAAAGGYSIVVSGQHSLLGGEAFVPSGVLIGYTEISGCIAVSADGTLVPQVALNA